MEIKLKFDFSQTPTKCDVCGSEHIRYTSNSEIYGKPYGNGGCYICDDCKSYVGVHNTKNKIPLGRFADKELRELKMQCHSIFDKFWKEEKLNRRDCYGYLANKLDLYLRETHFGWFDKEYLLKSLEIIKSTTVADIKKYIADRRERKLKEQEMAE